MPEKETERNSFGLESKPELLLSFFVSAPSSSDQYTERLLCDVFYDRIEWAGKTEEHGISSGISRPVILGTGGNNRERLFPDPKHPKQVKTLANAWFTRVLVVHH